MGALEELAIPARPVLTPSTIVSVTAGLRQPSSTRLLTDRLTEAVTSQLASVGVESSARTIELRDYAHDIVDMLLTGRTSASLTEAITAVNGAHALIAVTPVFTASYSGLFKSFVDILGKESLVDKPVLLGATGGSSRHQLALEYALRPLFAHLRADTVPTAVFAAPEDWGPEGEDRLAARIGRAADELGSRLHSRAGLRHTH
ncbi:CE1759 family FMN reductase [Streptomyces gilvus]|uniref:CE1759 family FMN reductase n=1 Tax=Streptomyces gilvus TaxID=2920937 RepID=UPI001F0D89D5|nr:CE1759 family FMN reductase [Streptomyces sp. CME 23]MCH5677635.1 NAD(P)H-dependent oxidoreductase [Streptomyces sp. CME 23]